MRLIEIGLENQIPAQEVKLGNFAMHNGAENFRMQRADIPNKIFTTNHEVETFNLKVSIRLKDSYCNQLKSNADGSHSSQKSNVYQRSAYRHHDLQ